MTVKRVVVCLSSLVAAGLSFDASADVEDVLAPLTRSFRSESLPNGLPFRNPTGYASTISTTGSIDLTNEFFQDLGTNGRRCVSCHLPSAGWSISPPQVRAIFALTKGGKINDRLGLGAIFRTNDGANSPKADVSTLTARRRAYSMLLTKGLIRVGIGIPKNADFELVNADDPYGYASAQELSLFRRPLPTTNLHFLSTVMWDGRETLPGNDHCNRKEEGGKCFAAMLVDFSDQANGATTGHAQGSDLSDAQRQAIVTFETSLTTAQTWDDQSRWLNARGGQGGTEVIRSEHSYYGINDNLGDYLTNGPFERDTFSLYGAWANVKTAALTAVARGEKLFNEKPITISGVAGLNGSVGSPFVQPLPDSFSGTCTTCHNTPNAGNHSIVAPLNIGLTDASRRTPDMPLYTFRNLATGATVQTTDPGRALISGKYDDIGKFKGPILRGLAARAPYFHNGFAKDLDAVVDFYNDRFNMALTEQEHRDLVAFLRSL